MRRKNLAFSAFLCRKSIRRLARLYRFTAEELDFIVKYDIKYRLGRGSGDEED